MLAAIVIKSFMLIYRFPLFALFYSSPQESIHRWFCFRDVTWKQLFFQCSVVEIILWKNVVKISVQYTESCFICCGQFRHGEKREELLRVAVGEENERFIFSFLLSFFFHVYFCHLTFERNRVLEVGHSQLFFSPPLTLNLIVSSVVYSLSQVQLFCKPIDCSPPGSSAQGISQARILEWVAISSLGDPLDLGIEPMSPALADRFFTTESPGKPHS